MMRNGMRLAPALTWVIQPQHNSVFQIATTQRHTTLLYNNTGLGLVFERIIRVTFPEFQL